MRVAPLTAHALSPVATIELMVVEHELPRVLALVASGLDTFLVDWESQGKDARQQGFDTEIRPATRDALALVCRVSGVRAWCRINRFGSQTADEVEAALGGGACGIFLPMVTGPREVERFLSMIGGRAQAAILVETVDALDAAADLAALPLDRVYFGLNDFAISRGGGSIFRAVLDGSVARARDRFAGIPFGFGGLTAIDAGHPVPCRRLLEEMARLDCTFSFVRRSFRRDTAGRDVRATAAGIQAAWRECIARDAGASARDHAALREILHAIA
jgi:hypothetical protein